MAATRFALFTLAFELSLAGGDNAFEVLSVSFRRHDRLAKNDRTRAISSSVVVYASVLLGAICIKKKEKEKFFCMFRRSEMVVTSRKSMRGLPLKNCCRGRDD
jgi:hypothetical protein